MSYFDNLFMTAIALESLTCGICVLLIQETAKINFLEGKGRLLKYDRLMM